MHYQYFHPNISSPNGWVLGSKKFHHTLFFVNDELDSTFVHYQFSTSSEETIKAKEACEADQRKHGKQVRHYHTTDGVHALAKHKQEMNDNKQTLTFYGI